MSSTAVSPNPPATQEPSPSDEDSFPFASGSRGDPLKHLSSVLTRHLCTLTSTISGYADLLTDARTQEEQRDIAMNVMEASSRIDKLLDDLRYYSRPLEPALRTVSVKEVVPSAVSLLEEEQRQRVCTKVEPEAAVEIDADPQLVRQALLNLLQNALEATGASGDVLLRATRVGDENAAGPAIGFEVWNDGEIGLDDPSKMFDPFFSARPQRLGLGLPIAEHIAECHDGTLELTTNSAAEGGTCFSLKI